jgi:hypothetical protein
VFRGGHTFKLEDMPLAEYQRRKQRFYNLLEPKHQTFNASGYVCVHYRHEIPSLDAADELKFGVVSPLSAFKERLRHVETPLFVASTSLEAKLEVMGWNPSRPTFWSHGTDLAAQLIYDWFALSTCDYILGTHGSSFSDEAVHLHGKSKECVGFRSGLYHTHSSVDNSTRYIHGHIEG